MSVVYVSMSMIKRVVQTKGQQCCYLLCSTLNAGSWFVITMDSFFLIFSSTTFTFSGRKGMTKRATRKICKIIMYYAKKRLHFIADVVGDNYGSFISFHTKRSILPPFYLSLRLIIILLPVQTDYESFLYAPSNI